MEVLEDIPTQLDLGQVLASLHSEKDSAQADEIEKTLELAQSLAHPRAIYEISYIEERDGDRVNLGGIWFSSRVLRRNLDQVYRVFPHIVTIGGALEEAASSSKDLLKQFQLDVIGNLILGASRAYLEKYLQQRYGLERLSRMSPGSLADWPLEEQGPLFSIFGDVESLIGVRLTDDYLMIPRKSISGIYFPTEVPFYSCQLCTRERCIGRKAPYDPNLVEQYRKPL